MPNIIANVLKIKNISSLPLLTDGKGNVGICFNDILPIPEDLNPETFPKDRKKDYAIMYYVTDRCTVPLRNITEEDMQLLENTAGNVLGRACLPTVFYKTYDWSLRHSRKSADELYLLGKRYVENYKNHGAATWRDWCDANWDTSWDASCCAVTENDPDALYFETAWNPPYGVLKALSQKYPDLPMNLMWADEMERGEAGNAVFCHGILQTKNEWKDTARQKTIHSRCWSSKPARYCG